MIPSKSLFIFILLSGISVTLVHSLLTYDQALVYTWINYLLTPFLQVNFFNNLLVNNFGAIGPYNLTQPPVNDVYRYIYFAAAAYCFSNIQTWTCNPCSNVPSASYYSAVSDDTLGLYVYFAVDSTNSEIISAFRGSYNGQNFIQDLTFVKVTPNDTSNDIKVHKGFYAALMKLYPEFKSTLLNLTTQYPDYKVTITGHSLGAALAGLATFQLKFDNVLPNSQMQLFTYGEPRGGNQAYADFSNSMGIPVARVVVGRDIIPQVPPVINGYVHRQNEYYVPDTTRTTVGRYCSKTVYEDPTCSDGTGTVYNVNDHLTYLGVYLGNCGFSDPVEWALEVLSILRPLIPQTIINRFPSGGSYTDFFVQFFSSYNILH